MVNKLQNSQTTVLLRIAGSGTQRRKKQNLQDTSHPLEVSTTINAHGHIPLTFGPHDLSNNKSDNTLTSDQSSFSIRNFRLPPRSS